MRDAKRGEILIMAKTAVVEKIVEPKPSKKSLLAYVALEDAIADKAVRLQVIATLSKAGLL